MKDKDKKTCAVCGARIPAFRIGVTCDPTCKRAHVNNRSRIAQIYADIRHADEQERFNAAQARVLEADAFATFEDDHYNQPYLVAV